MIKKLLLVCGLMVGAQAHGYVERFAYENELVNMYLDVDIFVNRIFFQDLVREYSCWLSRVDKDVLTREDALYILRITNLFNEVGRSYHIGTM